MVGVVDVVAMPKADAHEILRRMKNVRGKDLKAAATEDQLKQKECVAGNL